MIESNGMCEFTGAKVALTIATHPAKHNSSVRRVKSVRKRSKMVTRSRIRISDQDEVGDSDNHVLLSIEDVNNQWLENDVIKSVFLDT